MTVNATAIQYDAIKLRQQMQLKCAEKMNKYDGKKTKTLNSIGGIVAKKLMAQGETEKHTFCSFIIIMMWMSSLWTTQLHSQFECSKSNYMHCAASFGATAAAVVAETNEGENEIVQNQCRFTVLREISHLVDDDVNVNDERTCH